MKIILKTNIGGLYFGYPKKIIKGIMKLFLSLLILLYCTNIAMAIPYTTSQVNVHVTPMGDISQATPRVYNAGSSASAAIEGANTSLTSPGYGSSSGIVVASFGTLSVDVNAIVSGSSLATALGIGTFSDTISVLSDSLAFGTPVSLLLSNTINGGFVMGGTHSIGTLFSNLNVPGLTDTQIMEHVDFNVHNNSTTGIYSFQTTVGAFLTLNGTLQVEVGAGQDSSMGGNFGNTAHYYLDSLTSGVDLVSESGHNYSSAASVPEPSTLLLLGSGLAGLGFFGRNRRKRA